MKDPTFATNADATVKAVRHIIDQGDALRRAIDALYGSETRLTDRLANLLVSLREELDLAGARDAKPAYVLAAPSTASAGPNWPMRFVMDAAVRCNGWHPAETDGAGNPFRWSGPGLESSIALALDRRVPLRAHLSLIGAIEADVCLGLRVAVDGAARPFECIPTAFGWSISFALAPSELPRCLPTEITLRLPRTASPMAIGKGSDERKLGVAVSEIVVDVA